MKNDYYFKKISLKLIVLFSLTLCFNCSRVKKEEFKKEDLKESPLFNSNKQELYYFNSTECKKKKAIIEVEFDLKNYDEAIHLFKDFEDCIKSPHEYLLKLALLYKLNKQSKLFKNTQIELLNNIKKDKNLNKTEKEILFMVLEIIFKSEEYVENPLDDFILNIF
ncbi:hypothetical protein [Aureivirga marina]|uniref:hypothetical protein n=1 Tax=Aureivirga marina TaxID=1182451 RepID=UPI0018C8F4E7|nr:hypothetical protein [Aureivirga marina]